jgi:DNA-binding response OmpR family regulator
VSKRRLLLADDSPTIQKVVNLTFTDEGFEVTTVGDGDSALSFIRASRPDIVLLDVNMPGANGYDICYEMRQHDELREIPVILLVGSFEPFDELQASTVKANAYLTKPFQSIRQLIAQVNELLEASGTADAAPAAESEDLSEETIDDQSIDHPIEPSRHEKHEVPQEVSPVQTRPVDDIESLYSESFSNESRSEPGSDVGSGFDDGGLDDEMIETSYLAPNADTLDFEIVPPNGSEAAAEEEQEPSLAEYMPEETEGPSSQTYPDPFKSRVTDEAPVREVGGESQYPDTDRYQTTDLSEHRPEDLPEPFTMVETQVDEPAASASVEPTGLAQDLDDGQNSESPFSQMGIETVSFDAPQKSANFDDILLDIPPIGSNETLELTTAERAELMSSNKRAVSISDELMELIVERVVERMSQKY